MYYLCIVKQKKLMSMVNLTVVKFSKLRLVLRVYFDDGRFVTRSFRARHCSGRAVSCLESDIYNEFGFEDFSNGSLRVTHFSDSWRISFDCGSHDNITLIDLVF